MKYFFSADRGRNFPRKENVVSDISLVYSVVRRFSSTAIGTVSSLVHPHRQLVLFDDQRIEVLADVFYRRAGQKRPHKTGVRVLYRRRLFVVVLVLGRIERVPRVQRKPRLGQRAHGGKMRHMRPALGAHGGPVPRRFWRPRLFS